MKNQKKQKYLRKAREKGITLIALVITVIVLLILAGVSIGMITRDNGIVGQANQAKEDTIVADEKESLNMAIVSCMGKNKLGESIGDRQLEDELEKNQKEATVTVAGNDLEVTFDDTQHKYMVYQDGTIEQIIEGLGNYLVGDKYYDTFQEAFEAAESGSVIKVIYNTTEDSQIVIDKDITINTNRRTISLTNNARITINEKINVDINGNGVLTSENGLGIILNGGNLTTSNITMESPSGGSLQSTIVLIASGNFTSDNCNIDSITNEGETATINGGKYETETYFI